MSEPISYINRRTGKEEQEAVFGEAFLRLLYGQGYFSYCIGSSLLYTFVRSSPFSRVYGYLQRHPWSRRWIAPFIQRYGVDVSEFECSLEDMDCFDAFFTRKLKAECRPIAEGEEVLCSPADGRFLVYPQLDDCEGFLVKGQRFELEELLCNPSLAKRYRQGSMLLGRLCPTDYHRFHFPCAATPGPTQAINGWLYSVNPWALRKNIRYLTENKRVYCVLEGTPFGSILMMEVGATCVGSIHQSYTAGKVYTKGEEKGYFSFGGSTVILLFEPESICFDSDLIQNSSAYKETLLKMGEAIAVK